MKITSLDIRKQEFSRAFRGYDMDEVDSFLEIVAGQWQEVVDDLRRSEERVQEQQLKINHYMKVEEALEVALQTARTSARQTIENAEKKAKSMVEIAEERVVNLQKDADLDRLQIKRDTARYAVRQQEIVAKLRSFLVSELEILSHYDNDSAHTQLTGSEPRKEIELVREGVDENDHPTPADEPGIPAAFEDAGSAPEMESVADEPEDYVEVESEDYIDAESHQQASDSEEDASEEEVADDNEEISWRVTPIFESVDEFVDESDDETNVESHDDRLEESASEPDMMITDNEQDVRPAPEEDSGDDADEEIRKIHQILKDLDDE